MTDRSTPRRFSTAVVCAAAVLLAAGCSDDSSEEPESISVEPLSRIESPETSTPPAGRVSPSPSGLHSTTFDADTRTLVALDDSASTLLMFDASPGSNDDAGSNDAVVPRELALPGPAETIVAPGDGTLLLPMDGQLARVDLRDSSIESIPVEGNLRSAAVLANGRTAAGDDRGSIHIVDDEGSAAEVIDGLTSVDALASTDSGLTALDRRQTSLTVLDVDEGALGIALRAGEGAAELDTDRFGRILVTDAAGDALLVYSSDDLLLRQRFPVGAPPWAVTYDDKSDIVWITLPSTNEVVGYTLDTGIPVEVTRFPTVRQPDSIAVDSETGDLYVGSADGAGLQHIPTRNGR